MEHLKELLHERNCSLVLKDSNGGLHFFHNRGVMDLASLLEDGGDLLSGAVLADKVVGKGAAALMIKGGASLVYADLLSQPAKALLEASQTAFSYKEICDHIINRDRTGWCPVETLCKDSDDIDDLCGRILQFVHKMKDKK